MAKESPRSKSDDAHQSTGELLRSIDPQKSVWLVTAVALVVILAYSLRYPQEAYPRFGIMPSVGLVFLTIAAGLVVARAPWLGIRTLWPVVVPCLLFLWAAWRTASALVPSEGIMLLGTLLEGCLVFTIALVLAAVGKHWRTFRPEWPSEASEPGRRSEEDSEPPRLFENSVLVVALGLGFAMALTAVYEFFISYDDKFSRLYEELIVARGREYAELTPREWGLLERLGSKRVGAFFGQPNVLAGFLSMVAPLAVAAFVRWRDRTARIAALAALGLSWYVVLLTRSRGGLLTIAFATAAAAVLLGPAAWRNRRGTLAVGGAVCAIAIVLASISIRGASRPMTDASAPPVPTRSYSFIERLFNAPTVAQRLYYLQSGWEMIREAPALGHGLGAYAVLYPRHIQPKARETRYPHNILCHYWVETGLVGLVLWCAWVGVVIVGAAGHLWRRRREPDSLGVRMLLVAAVVFLFNNLFELTWTFREAHLFWCLILGVVAGLIFAGRPPKEAGDEPVGFSLGKSAAPLAILGVPILLAVVFSNSVLLRPLVAKACQLEANDLRRIQPVDVEMVMRRALKVIRFQPKNPYAHHWMAMFHADLGQVAEARYEFDKAIALHPRSAQIHADYAGFESKVGQPEAARKRFSRATELYPRKTEYVYRWARFEKNSGNTTDSLRLIEKAINLTVDNRERQRYLDFRRDLLSTGTLSATSTPK